MDPRLLRYYNQELQHFREMGAEFAREFPKIAARLGIEGLEVTDPYVERLIEGVAFLAGRVQLKLDAEFPRFTERLLEIVYPNVLTPTPSMVVAQFQPEFNDANLAKGVTLPRGSAMFGRLGQGDQTACEFRTGADVELYPIELVSAQYFTHAPDLPMTALGFGARARAGVRLRLRATAGLTLDLIRVERLRFFLGDAEEIAFKLFELCGGAVLGGLVCPVERPLRWHTVVSADEINRVGYTDDEALLPAGERVFSGYRLLQEYFSFPYRFLFIDVGGLAPAFGRHAQKEIELVLFFDRGDAALENAVNAANFALYCAPAINLFPKRADPIHVADNLPEYQVIADRHRPIDFEVFQVTGIKGHGAGTTEQTFAPFYAATRAPEADTAGYFTVQREPRLVSEKQARTKSRTAYVGTEVYVALADPNEAPYRSDLRQLSVMTLCTNRDLPLQMPVGLGDTDFTLDMAAPVRAVRCVKGPSRPFSPIIEGGIPWRFISHLALNYVALLESDEQSGAAALRELLELWATSNDLATRRQIEGVRNVRLRRIVRRLPAQGPITFGRGVEITVTVDDLAFQGGSAFLLGCVLEQFFARYVSINSFTETALQSAARGEIKRWKPRWGDRPIL